MGKQIASPHREHLESRSEQVQSGHHLTWRGFWVGSFLSFFLAIGAPYGNMILKGDYLALDISTPGAIFLFLLLIGLLNFLFKLAARGRATALVFALFAVAAWFLVYWPLTGLDPLSPGWSSRPSCWSAPWRTCR